MEDPGCEFSYSVSERGSSMVSTLAGWLRIRGIAAEAQRVGGAAK